MKSIRANLVLWVVSTLVLGTVIVLAATYALTRKQVGRLFDDCLKVLPHLLPESHAPVEVMLREQKALPQFRVGQPSPCPGLKSMRRRNAVPLGRR